MFAWNSNTVELDVAEEVEGESNHNTHDRNDNTTIFPYSRKISVLQYTIEAVLSVSHSALLVVG